MLNYNDAPYEEFGMGATANGLYWDKTLIKVKANSTKLKWPEQRNQHNWHLKLFGTSNE